MDKLCVRGRKAGLQEDLCSRLTFSTITPAATLVSGVDRGSDNCRVHSVFLACLPHAGGAKEAEMEGCC